MIRAVIKEFSILLLILIVIELGLMILFYDYNSTNKIIPSKKSGQEEAKTFEELSSNLDLYSNTASIQKYIVTYRVDSEDLTAYAKQDDYNAGKNNPFAQYSTTTTLDENPTNENNSNISNSNSTVENNTSGTFFNTVGK